MTADQPQTIQYCTFYLDDGLYGIPILKLQEIVRYRDMMTVPLAPPEVAGLLNLRGQIVMAIDLRARMGLASRKIDNRPINLIVRSASDTISLLVDRIGDMVEVDSTMFDPTPPTVPSGIRDLVSGTYKLSNQLLVVIDPDIACNLNVAEAS